MTYQPLTKEREDQLAKTLGNVTRNADFNILKAILEHGRQQEDGTYQITTNDIAEAARCDKHTVYKRVRIMQNTGYLKRIADDRRKVRFEDRDKEQPGGIYQVLV